MPSTYTANGGLELIGDGEQTGTWGTTTNENLEIIDRLTNGVGSITLSGTTHTLTTSDGVLSDGQYKVLLFGGSPSGTNTVTISPNDASKVYIVKNNTSQSVVLTQGSGGNVTVPAGKSAIVYANGAGATAAVVDITSTFSFVTLTGTETLTNKTIAYGSNTLTDVVGVSATQTLTNKTLTDPAIIGTILEDVFTITDGAAFEIDPGNGSVQLITLGAARTPKATNFAAGEAITLMVDDGSAYTITWTDATFGGSGVVWKTDGGVAPTLNTTGYTVIVLWKVGTQVYGARVGDA